MLIISQNQCDRPVPGRGAAVRFILLSLFSLFIGIHISPAAELPHAAGDPGSDIHLHIVVSDADLKTPMELVRVVLRRGKTVAGQTVTGPTGIAAFDDISAGQYILSAHFIGYADYVDTIDVDEMHELDSIGMHVINMQEVVVSGQHEVNISSFDLKTGTQVFESETYHSAPTGRITNLIQENMMGAARAPTGEVHVRGQHGEFTYYIDGIPVPLGVFGGLNEIVDPKVIDRATFLTGGFPAEYGGQTAAVIDVQNRVPPGRFHLDASMYGGSYLSDGAGDSAGTRVGSFRNLNSNGQNLSMSSHFNKFGFYLSGQRQETDRRIDPPTSILFHDHGFDYFLYGKFDYDWSTTDYLTANFNFGKTLTQVPYDSLEGIAEDVQTTTNAFQTLSYFHILSDEKNKESNLFIGGFAREGGLLFSPGMADQPTFQFAGDSVNSYVLAEDRSFTTIGLRSTYDARLAHEFKFTTGISASATSGKEAFTSRDSSGTAGPNINTEFAGSDFGVFAEGSYHPADWTTFDAGIRYDQHIAPDASLQNQLSPRLKWQFNFDESNSAYLYFGRLFMPNNIEGLRTIASNVTTSGEATLPERDNLYEGVFTHGFPFGLRAKTALFYKYATPGVDDQTVGASAIKTPVNIQTVKTTGLEIGLSFSDPSTPFTGYINTSIIHAYGSGTISGGFLDIDDAGDATDLDHDQRMSVVASVNYQPQNWFANVTAIYGSGLTNGDPDGLPYKTGLFDFNVGTHTAPSMILNVSFGHTFALDGTTTLEPSIFVTNLLDHDHLIKGAFFSGASYEERRNVVFKVAVHM